MTISEGFVRHQVRRESLRSEEFLLGPHLAPDFFAFNLELGIGAVLRSR